MPLRRRTSFPHPLDAGRCGSFPCGSPSRSRSPAHRRVRLRASPGRRRSRWLNPHPAPQEQPGLRLARRRSTPRGLPQAGRRARQAALSSSATFDDPWPSTAHCDGATLAHSSAECPHGRVSHETRPSPTTGDVPQALRTRGRQGPAAEAESAAARRSRTAAEPVCRRVAVPPGRRANADRRAARRQARHRADRPRPPRALPLGAAGHPAGRPGKTGRG